MSFSPITFGESLLACLFFNPLSAITKYEYKLTGLKMLNQAIANAELCFYLKDAMHLSLR